MRLSKLFPRLQRRWNTDDGSLYMTRLMWGRLRFHVFHRGDLDPDLHDHPWRFWTFPFTPYIEEIIDENSLGGVRRQTVTAFKLHYRPGSYAHRVIGPSAPWAKRIYTLVWRGAEGRSWGFLRRDGEQWCWIPRRVYLYTPGAKTAPCDDVGARA